MSNFWKSNFFATRYWEGDQYWRPKVPVPVPVPVPIPTLGGGAGLWPLSRFKRDNPECYSEFVKEQADDICKPKKGKKLGKGHEQIPGKGTPQEKLRGEIFSIKKKIHDINDDLRGVGGEVQSGKAEKAIELRRQLSLLRLLLKKANRMYRRLAKQPGSITKAVREGVEKAVSGHPVFAKLEAHVDAQAKIQAEAEAVKAETATAVAQAAPERSFVGLAQQSVEDRTQVYRGIVSALPWAVGSFIVVVATYQLVPDDHRVLKFAGYAASGILGAISIWRGFAAYGGA